MTIAFTDFGTHGVLHQTDETPGGVWLGTPLDNATLKFVHFCFQEIDFYEGCLVWCTNCTLSQMFTWNYTHSFTKSTNEYLIALHGIPDKIVISPQAKTSAVINIKWLKDPELPLIYRQRFHEPRFQKSDESVASFAASAFNLIKSQFGQFINVGVSDLDALKGIISDSKSRIPSKFPTIEGYNLHSFTIKISSVMYTFVKYMSRTISSTTEYSQYLRTEERAFAYDELRDTYPQCPNISHHPKLFSWNEAAKFCATYEGSILPEFISRAEEERLITVIKNSAEIFPIDALFVGLRKRMSSQVFLPFRHALPLQIETINSGRQRETVDTSEISLV